ncbi:hypothetical protein JTB14_006510 [Gonioctena quinquepunctata]|nr:hypothetical protein JTB14_006510 [Gonioctena quinquepunctata]
MYFVCSNNFFSENSVRQKVDSFRIGHTILLDKPIRGLAGSAKVPWGNVCLVRLQGPLQHQQQFLTTAQIKCKSENSYGVPMTKTAKRVTTS